MIYLILAILFSTGVFVAMRLFEHFKLDNHQALMWNYVFAAGTGFLMCKQFDTLPQLVAEPWFGLSLVTGFWFIFTYLLMTATQRSGVTITSLSSKLSVVLPTLAGVILFSEKLNFVATMGIVLALVALVLVVGTGKGDAINRVSTNRILPLLIFFGTGTGDILTKLTGLFLAALAAQLILNALKTLVLTVRAPRPRSARAWSRSWRQERTISSSAARTFRTSSPSSRRWRRGAQPCSTPPTPLRDRRSAFSRSADCSTGKADPA